MAIKIKNRDPKTTDFASNDIVINHKEGTLFFKSDSSLVKLGGSSDTSGWDGSAITLTGKLTGGSIEIEGSNFDINGGTIDDTNITVGSGKTLNVSAGNLTLANNQISGDKVEGGTIASTTITTLATAAINASTDIDIGAHDLRAATLTADGLTSGRVIFAGTNGVLSDDSDLTFSTDTLTATKIGAFTAAGAINFDSQNMTNVDIDSGTIDGTNVTVGASKTLNVSAGTLTTSTAQKKAIIDGAAHHEVLTTIQPMLSNYASQNDPAGNAGAAGDWYGPKINDGFSQFTINYGDDSQVLSLVNSKIHTGIIVPFACTLIGFYFTANVQGGTPGIITPALYYGDFAYANGSSGASSFNITSGTATALTLALATNCSVDIPAAPTNNPVAASVTNGTTELAAQDMIYPRIKWATDESKDVYMNWTILIKRA